MVGVKDRCFEDEYEGKAEEVKRIWLDYVRNIFAEKLGGAPPINGGAKPDTDIQKDPEGFPLLPVGMSVDDLNKKEAERLARSYLKLNYGEPQTRN